MAPEVPILICYRQLVIECLLFLNWDSNTITYLVIWLPVFIISCYLSNYINYINVLVIYIVENYCYTFKLYNFDIEGDIFLHSCLKAEGVSLASFFFWLI